MTVLVRTRPCQCALDQKRVCRACHSHTGISRLQPPAVLAFPVPVAKHTRAYAPVRKVKCHLVPPQCPHRRRQQTVEMVSSFEPSRYRTVIPCDFLFPHLPAAAEPFTMVTLETTAQPLRGKRPLRMPSEQPYVTALCRDTQSSSAMH